MLSHKLHTWQFMYIKNLYFEYLNLNFEFKLATVQQLMLAQSEKQMCDWLTWVVGISVSVQKNLTQWVEGGKEW